MKFWVKWKRGERMQRRKDKSGKKREKMFAGKQTAVHE